MRARRLSVALAAVAIPALAATAFAVAGSVGTRPGPQVVIPTRTAAVTRTTVDDHRADPAEKAPEPETTTKTANTVKTPTTTKVSDDGPGHDVGDDHGGDSGSGH